MSGFLFILSIVTQVLSLAGLIPGFAVLTRRLFGSALAGIVGATLAILLDAQLEFWHTAQPESFGGVLTVLGLVLATSQPQERGKSLFCFKTWGCWVGAGVLFGLAGLMKPQLAVAGAVAALLPILELRQRALKLWKQTMPLAAILVGITVSLLGCVIWFASKGGLGAMVQALFEFAPAYGSTTWDWAWWPGYMYLSFELFAVGASAPMCVGLLFAIALPVASPRERGTLGVLAGILAIHLIGIAVQSKFFPYHFAATYPIGALIAGLGVMKAWRMAQRWGALGLVVFAVLFYVAARARTTTRDLSEMSYWERSWLRMDAWIHGDARAREDLDATLYSVADVEYGSNMRVVRWLQANTSNSDTIFIWGFEPFIYDISGRRPASRYIYNVPQRLAWHRDPEKRDHMLQLRDQARQSLIDDLKREQPKVIVVEHRDVFPVVTHDSIDSQGVLSQFPQLRTLIDTRYSLVTTLGDFDLYSRLPGESDSSPGW